MFRFLTYLTIVVSAIPSIKAQVFKYAHVNSFVDTNQVLYHSISVDANGNLYKAGNFKGWVDFDYGQGEYKAFGKGLSENFVAKYDADGNLIWLKTIPAGRFTNFNFSKLDQSGDLIVAGYFYDSMQCNGNDPGGKLVSEGYEDVFVMKLDGKDGAFKWIRRIGNYALNYAYGFDVNQDGDIVIAGRFSYDLDVDPGPGQRILSANIKNNTFFVALDKDGAFKWEKHMGGDGHTHAYSIRYDGQGHIIACGSFSGKIALTSEYPEDTVDSKGLTKSFLMKMDSKGSRIWTEILDGTSYNEVYCMDVNDKGRILVAGLYQNKIGFDDNDTLVSKGGYSIFILKLDSSGNQIWHRGIGSPGNDHSYSVKMDDLENVYLCGMYGGDIDINPGPMEKHLPFAGLQDGFLLKLDHAGNYRGSQCIGGTNFDYVSILAVKGADVYFGGIYSDTASLSLTGQYEKLPGVSLEQHSYIIKISTVGLGMETVVMDRKPSVYPNPAQSACIVQLAGLKGVEVMNAQGVSVSVDVSCIDEDNMGICWNDLTDGIYLVRCIDKFGRTYIQRLIIQ